MEIKVYDITLIRLRHEHIEELRQRRNSDKVKMRMEYREYITPEMQEEWFKKINSIMEGYLYMMIVYKGKNVGMINGKGKGNESEGGIFFWDEDCLNSHIPLLTSIAFTDITFFFLQNTQTFGKMLRDNLSAVSFNKSLGFQLCEGQEDKYNQLYKLTKEEYEKRAQGIREMLKKIYRGQEYVIRIQIQEEDERNGFADVVRKYSGSYDARRSPVKVVVEHESEKG